MRYHAPTQQFTVDAAALHHSAMLARWAIRKIRDAGGFPPEGGNRPGAMTDACHAEQAVIDALLRLGIDLGATRAGELDVRDAN